MKAETQKILEILNETYPNAKCALNYETPFQLLVATILSAQTTDKKVNEVTKVLFSKYPDVDSFLKITKEELESIIKQIGLYRNKSKNIMLMVRQLKDNYDGEVPQTMEEIVKLAGAGRKTANVVLSNAFNVPAIAVDTHVFRVSNRIGIANSNNVLEVEKQLQKEIEKSKWSHAHHLLIFHGRNCCTSRNPKCNECPIKLYCKQYRNLGATT